MKHMRTVVVAAVALATWSATAPARPFIDPRAERNETIDRAI
jgi:hypothetical protein